ncbi:MAG: hypothetical protein ABIR18_09160, partial [Chitinophagaceae bacterium]
MTNTIKILLLTLVSGQVFINYTYSQELTLKKMIDATTCRQEDCFLDIIKDFDLCHIRTRTDSTGTYYRHQNCGADSASANRLIVHFAVLRNNNYNSSFLTWSEKYSKSLEKELEKYHFKKIDNADDPNKERIWYHSADYSHLNIMWEELIDDKNVKRWHMGLVWE